MAEIPNVRLNLSNGPESVAIAHELLLGLAEVLGLDALETDDLCTAVGEVCKNVVYHAYEGQTGPLELEVYTFAGAVEVVVRDHG
ncbi:MAG TPA: ATP-binding protein, partial [Solirubrobacteraceae bacterium]|nr:ATP-binding protein [Solirubrobacteraceae bacterium]